MSGDSRFHDVLAELAEMHDRKQADYGREGDPFSNVRASEDFGIPGWVGCMVRANDKMRRLQKAAGGGALANESIEDSLIDLAVYSVIALVLYRETARHVVSLDESDLDALREPGILRPPKAPESW